MNAHAQTKTRTTNATSPLPALLADARLYNVQKREERAAELVTLTSRLILIPSVSGDNQKRLDKENDVAKEIFAYLNGIKGVDAKLVEITDDVQEPKRFFVFGFLKGRGKKTLALTGHFDTVGFGSEEEEKLLLAPRVEGDFLYGRGAHDMKSGIAVQMLALKELASRRDQLNGNIAFIAVPDEENNSAGIMAAMSFFEKFLREHGLECVGIINSDYTAPIHAQDDLHYIYTGTIGKLLPTILVRGIRTHVGEAFNGLSAVSLLAEITRRIEVNAALCDESHGEATLPPTALAHRDLKSFYNVETPSEAVAYYNFFALSLSPRQVLERLWRICFEASRKVVADYSFSHQFFNTKNSFPSSRLSWQPRVLTFEDLLADMKEREPKIEGEVKKIVDNLSRDLDVRDASIAVALKLLLLQGSRDPTILLCFSPPYYPAIPPLQQDSVFMQAIRETVESFNARGEGPPIKTRAFYPYISDMSYMVKAPDFDRDRKEIIANMPVYGDRYSIILPSFSPPIANIGPFGHDAHKPGERTFIPYSFKLLPEVLLEVIARVFEK